jgi:hypothetical protein
MYILKTKSPITLKHTVENVSVCFEDSDRCDLEDIPVLRNSLLNKGQCNFQTEFPDEGIFTIIKQTFFSFNNSQL